MKYVFSLRYAGHLMRMIRSAAILGAVLCVGMPLRGQDAAQGPLQPLPDHHVTRIETGPVAVAPPSLPEDQIVQRFSRKEEEFLSARAHYTYRKTMRIQEFGVDGQPAGEYVVITEPTRNGDGTMSEKVVQRPQSTLQSMRLITEDLATLQRIPAYPLTSSQLAKYQVRYIGKDTVDEVSCYMFEVKPKQVERTQGLFEGIVWVDDKYLEVVKTYGKWISELGDMKSDALPFTIFETYRQYVDEKYWFPNYSRSDVTIHHKDQDIPIRVTIKWTEFKPFTATASPQAVPSPAKPESKR